MPGTEGSTIPSSVSQLDRDIREMIQQVLEGLRSLPASSGRLEQGTYYIQKALGLLDLGRYGSAQIEVNRAARLVREGPPHRPHETRG